MPALMVPSVERRNRPHGFGPFALYDCCVSMKLLLFSRPCSDEVGYVYGVWHRCLGLGGRFVAPFLFDLTAITFALQRPRLSICFDETLGCLLLNPCEWVDVICVLCVRFGLPSSSARFYRAPSLALHPVPVLLYCILVHNFH